MGVRPADRRRVIASGAGREQGMKKKSGKQEEAKENRPVQLPVPRFWLLVLVPTAIALSYFLFVAATQYTAESQFLIRQSGSPSTEGTPVSKLLTGGGQSGSQQDARLVRDYIRSPDLYRRLDREIQLRVHYGQKNWDPFARMDVSDPQEKQVDFLRRKIGVEIDPETAVVTLSTRAFSPEFAERFNRAILEASEEFINQISRSLAEAQVSFVKAQVAEAEATLTVARNETVAFQSKYEIIDPETESASLSGRISGLETRLSEKETELKTLQGILQQNSPQLARLRREVEALRAQIEEETRSLVGGEDRTISQIMSEYQSLRIEQEFARNAYSSALASLEAAQRDAARQMKYLIPISSTGEPQESSHPNPLRGTLTVFLVATLLFFVARLVVATINDHTT